MDPQFRPDLVGAPEVRYAPPTISFRDEDEEHHVRVSFERWDALRVCRGEYLPYPFEPNEAPSPWPIAFVVESSPWLAERYAYEKKHYERAYEFGGDVQEMLRDFDHYLFSFHDQFVEVIAAGLWFERSERPLAPDEWQPDHPFRGLGPECVIETGEYRGIGYDIRRNPHPLATMEDRARLCAQPLFWFTSHLGSQSYPDLSIAIRRRHGKTFAVCRNLMGVELDRIDGIPSLDYGMQRFRGHLDEVFERRRSKGLG